MVTWKILNIFFFSLNLLMEWNYLKQLEQYVIISLNNRNNNNLQDPYPDIKICASFTSQLLILIAEELYSLILLSIEILNLKT